MAAIIQSTRDTVDTASQTTFNPTKLTKNQNVNEIDHEKDHEFRQDEKIKGTKKKGCFRCRFLRRNEKRSETRINSYCTGCSKWVCKSCYDTIHADYHTA